MPLTAAAGSISLAVDNLRVTLADSAAFRTWSGTSTQAAALARIYYESLPPPTDKNEHTLVELTALRPYAAVWTDEFDGFTYRQDAALSTPKESGTMLIKFEQTVDPTIVNDYPEISRRFINAIGTIIEEVMDFYNVGGYLAIEQATLMKFGRGDPDERSAMGDYMAAVVKCEWGQR